MSLLARKMRTSALPAHRALTSLGIQARARAYSDRPNPADGLTALFSRAADAVSDAVTRPLESREGQYAPIDRENRGRPSRGARSDDRNWDSKPKSMRVRDGSGFSPSTFATSGDRESRPRGSRKSFNNETYERGTHDNSYTEQKGGETGSKEPSSQARTLAKNMDVRARRLPTAPSLITLAQLTVPQISGLIDSALVYKHLHKLGAEKAVRLSLLNKSVALLFSKRSTRTRVASESATAGLGGNCMFLGRDDIQLGVNESEEDTARVIGSMVDGIMARVGAHSEVENLAKFSPVPVINALSDLYHPTQILADLMTLVEIYNPPVFPSELPTAVRFGPQTSLVRDLASQNLLAKLKGKKIAWVGDTNNITNDMLVCFPRLGMTMSLASPAGYDKVDERVWAEVVKAGTEGKIVLTNSPAEALKDADIVATDTWISMGQETEKASRLAAFAGYQVTESLCSSAGANPDWKFLHCLPRKQEEVDDEVFYGKRSVVFQEAENRKWTTMACFSHIFGDWKF